MVGLLPDSHVLRTCHCKGVYLSLMFCFQDHLWTLSFENMLKQSTVCFFISSTPIGCNIHEVQITHSSLVILPHPTGFCWPWTARFFVDVQSLQCQSWSGTCGSWAPFDSKAGEVKGVGKGERISMFFLGDSDGDEWCVIKHAVFTIEHVFFFLEISQNWSFVFQAALIEHVCVTFLVLGYQLHLELVR